MKKSCSTDPIMRPAAVSTNGKTRLEKAIRAEKRAMATVREVQARLVAAAQILATARAQTAKEEKAARIVRAATKDLLAAKRKLRKAQKKSKRAMAQTRVHPSDRTAVSGNGEAAAWPAAARPPSGSATLMPRFSPGKPSRFH